MTTIDAAVNAIKQTQAQMQARIDLLEESDRNAAAHLGEDAA